MDPGNANRLYAGTRRVWRTTNGAFNWQAISPFFSGHVSAIGVARSNSNVLYAGTDNGTLMVTTNGGFTWTNTASHGLPARFVTDIAVSPNNPAVAYATVSGYGTGHLFRTTNFGGTWTNVSGFSLPNAPANAIAVDWRTFTPKLYVGNDVGVFSSVNGGSSWQDAGAGLPNTVVNDLVVDTAANRLLGATFGRGAWSSPLL